MGDKNRMWIVNLRSFRHSNKEQIGGAVAYEICPTEDEAVGRMYRWFTEHQADEYALMDITAVEIPPEVMRKALGLDSDDAREVTGADCYDCSARFAGGEPPYA